MNWRPDKAILVLTGDITPEQGFALAEQAFGDWPRPAEPPPPPPGGHPNGARRATSPSTCPASARRR